MGAGTSRGPRPGDDDVADATIEVHRLQPSAGDDHDDGGNANAVSSEHPLDDLLLNRSAEEPLWQLTIQLLVHALSPEEDNDAPPAGFAGRGGGGALASAAAIAGLERREYGGTPGPTRKKKKKKRRRGTTGGEVSLSISPTAAACPICLEDFAVGDGLLVMPCAHGFHESCLTQWLARSRCCPCCRHALPTDDDEEAGRDATDADRSTASDGEATGAPRRSSRGRHANVRLSGPEWASST